MAFGDYHHLHSWVRRIWWSSLVGPYLTAVPGEQHINTYIFQSRAATSSPIKGYVLRRQYRQSRSHVSFASCLKSICGRWKPRWAGTQHTFSSPASQGNRARYSCFPGKAKLHDLLFHLQVSTGHANLDNCTAAIFLHTNKPQFSWINSPADWNLARFSLTGTRKSPLFPPMFIKHFFLSLQRKYHFLIASFKLSLCSSGGNSAPFCSLTSKTLLRIFSTPPPQSQAEENKWESFLSYLSMIRLCSAQRQQVSEVVKLATSLTSSANSKAFWITLQFDLKKFDAMSNKIK